MKKIITIILLTIFCLSIYAQEFVSGEIIIGFIDSVDGSKAIKILKELKLELKNRPFAQYRYVYYFKTKKDENNRLKNSLEKSQLFTLVDIPLDDKGIDISSNSIFAYTKLTTKKSDVKKLIESLKNIEIKSIETNSISILVKVSIGEENKQIKKASKHKSVRYAELNGISVLDDNASNKGKIRKV